MVCGPYLPEYRYVVGGLASEQMGEPAGRAIAAKATIYADFIGFILVFIVLGWVAMGLFCRLFGVPQWVFLGCA